MNENKTPYLLALASSPSKGFNSDTMLDSFIDGAKSTGVNIEKIYLYDLQIPDYEFARRVPLDTPEEKDLKMIAEKIKSAQGLVIATPTWNFNVPGKLKNLFDRLRFIGLDYTKMNMLGQPTGQLGYLKTYFLVSGGTPGWAQKLLFTIFPPFWLSVAFFYYGAKIRGSIYGGGLKGTFTAKDNPTLLARCRRAGARFAKRLG